MARLYLYNLVNNSNNFVSNKPVTNLAYPIGKHEKMQNCKILYL